MKLQILTLTAAAVLFCACNNADTSSDTTAGSGIDTAQLAPSTDSLADAPVITVDTVKPVVTHVATISTTAGDIELELYGEDAPKAVKNFEGLAKKGYYEGVLFHRVEPGFVIQGGDPLSKNASQREKWGSGGESIYGATFEDELNPNSPSGRRGYVEGTLAMANAGPNTNGSQFFIVLSNEGARHLTYNYTIFGAVSKGMDVAHKIEAMAGGVGGTPQDPVKMTKVTVKEVAPQATGTTGETAKK